MPVKLLGFLALCKVDLVTNEFAFNKQVKQHFKDYCNMFGESYEDNVTEKGLRQLVNNNNLCERKTEGLHDKSNIVYQW